jgi:folate-binding protein YgfZ
MSANVSSVTTFVVDRSERGKLALTGPEAKDFLHGQVTNDILRLEPGQGLYAAFLTNKGKMLGDLRVFDLGGELLIDCERVALQGLFNLLHRTKLGRDVELHKRTLQMALLSVIGPDAPPLVGAGEHACARVELGGASVVAVRTDLGVDVFCRAEDRDAVRAALKFPDGDETAAEIARVESGRPRYGVDLDDSVIPQEAGLNERAVSFTKGCYVGQETVARLHYRGKPNRRLLGVKLDAPLRPGTELRLGEKVVGKLGSVVVSPDHGPIGLALVRREAGPGDTVQADGTSALIVEIPFAR